MTTRPTHPRARHLGLLSVAFYALLSPSGKIISSAAAATLLIGGLVTQLRPPAPSTAQAPVPTPVVPTRLAHSGSSAPVFTYIEVDGQTLPVVLTENPTGNSSVAPGPASASPSLDLSGGGGGMPGTGSPHFSPRSGMSALPSQSTDGPSPAPEVNPPPSIGSPIQPPYIPKELSCIPTAVSSESPNALPPGALPCPTLLAGSGDPANNDSSEAGSLPPQGEPGNEPHVSSPGNVPGGLSEAPESEFPTGTDDPLNPLIDRKSVV